MDNQYTTKEEYARIRQEHIVNKIYRGDDNLPPETKEQLLKAAYGPNVEFGEPHMTTLDAEGKSVGDGHVRFHQQVSSLELGLLLYLDLVSMPLL